MFWFHCSSYGLVLSVIRFFSDWRVEVGLVCRVVDRLTCHIPAVPLQLPYRTVFNFLYTIMCVALYVYVQTSSHSCLF